MPPNFVIVLTDDHRADMLSPGGETLVKTPGFHFINAFATSPMCGPSRASFLTGQHAPIHGVVSNVNTATTFGLRPHLGTALQSVGYTTAYAGKWLNDYNLMAPTLPPGWTHFLGYTSPNVGHHFNYTLNDHGTLTGYTNRYLTDVLRDRVVQWLGTLTQPFCVILAPGAPHSPYTPAPRHVGACATAPWPAKSSHFEPDMTDKPIWLREFQAVHGPNQAQLTADILTRHRAQREMLLAVDEALQAIVTTLSDRGILNTTALITMADNGIMEHEHWWHQKSCFYDESIRIPCCIRYAGWSGSGITVVRPITVMDIGVTILSMASAPLPASPTDGRDLRTIFTAPATWRTWVPLHYTQHTGFPLANIPGYTGVREHNLTTGKYFAYAQHTDGFEECYDHSVDPYQLANVAYRPAYTAERTRLRALVGLA